MRRFLIFLAFALCGLLSVSCAHHKKHRHGKDHGCAHCTQKDCADKASGHCAHHGEQDKTSFQALAEVMPLGKNKVKGTVAIVPSAEGLKLSVNLTGLKANQKHGFHIHEFGVCGADGKAAGGHYNPTMMPHAAPTDEKRHMGDLGNIKADAKGAVTTEIMLGKASLHKLLGRTVIVHAKEDDLKSQPAGDAGDRIGCGVIGLTQ